MRTVKRTRPMLTIPAVLAVVMGIATASIQPCLLAKITPARVAIVPRRACTYCKIRGSRPEDSAYRFISVVLPHWYAAAQDSTV